MISARIDGNAVATIAHPSLKGLRLLICQPVDESGNDSGEPVIAFDEMGAGLHSKVFYTTDGSAAREHAGDAHSPLRNMIAGIIDEEESK
ncbi:EutN/CcmL family microcompartment protein [Rubellicoccus peritrichatus]|uniref:EutN/CcmL family microcompartment protein n=1 Tax=Rubellicoccus peritrichatus TaxID=3080537 RepID=A0AAQ3LG79_9BACT|nr:EutN/CcmL family microcompartment protein [Puniceicoccus sp. CR14]WOO41569.1 EutN/CcmL family microcompartment protein [Puniceicoccus sp. CR14]